MEIELQSGRTNETKTKFNFFKANYMDIKEYISGRNWEVNLEDRGVENLWAKLKNE